MVQVVLAELERLEAEIATTNRLYDTDQGRGAGMSDALSDVSAERDKQRSKWGDTHDDAVHSPGDLGMCGSSYAMAAAVWLSDTWLVADDFTSPDVEQFPFGPDAWKMEATPRAGLVKAAAMIVAEIERIDRTAAGVTL